VEELIAANLSRVEVLADFEICFCDDAALRACDEEVRAP